MGKKYELGANFSIDSLISALAKCKTDAQQVDGILANIGKRGNLNKFIEQFVKMDDSVKDLVKDLSTMKSSLGSSLDKGYMTNLDKMIASLTEIMSLSNEVFSGVKGVNLNTKGASDELKQFATQLNSLFGKVGIDDKYKIDFEIFDQKEINDQFNMVVDAAKQLNGKIQVILGDIDFSKIGGFGESNSSDVGENLANAAKEQLKEIKKELVKVYKTYYKEITNILDNPGEGVLSYEELLDGAMSEKMEQLQSQIESVIEKIKENFDVDKKGLLNFKDIFDEMLDEDYDISVVESTINKIFKEIGLNASKYIGKVSYSATNKGSGTKSGRVGGGSDDKGSGSGSGDESSSANTVAITSAISDAQSTVVGEITTAAQSIVSSIGEAKQSIDDIQSLLQKDDKQDPKQQLVDSIKKNLTDFLNVTKEKNNTRRTGSYGENYPNNQELQATLFVDGSIAVANGESGSVPWNNIVNILLENLNKKSLFSIHSHPYKEKYMYADKNQSKVDNMRYLSDWFSGSKGDIGEYITNERIGEKLAGMLTGNILTTLDLEKIAEKMSEFWSNYRDIEEKYYKDYPQYMYKSSDGTYGYKSQSSLSELHRVSELKEKMVLEALSMTGLSSDVYKKYDLTNEIDLTELATKLAELSMAFDEMENPIERLKTIIRAFNADVETSDAKTLFESLRKGETDVFSVFKQLTGNNVDENVAKTLKYLDSANMSSLTEQLLSQISSILSSIESIVSSIAANTQPTISQELDDYNDLISNLRNGAHVDFSKHVPSEVDYSNITEYKAIDLFNKAASQALSFDKMFDKLQLEISDGEEIDVSAAQDLIENYIKTLSYISDAKKQIELAQNAGINVEDEPNGVSKKGYLDVLSNKYSKNIGYNNYTEEFDEGRESIISGVLGILSEVRNKVVDYEINIPFDDDDNEYDDQKTDTKLSEILGRLTTAVDALFDIVMDVKDVFKQDLSYKTYDDIDQQVNSKRNVRYEDFKATPDDDIGTLVKSISDLVGVLNNRLTDKQDDSSGDEDNEVNELYGRLYNLIVSLSKLDIHEDVSLMAYLSDNLVHRIDALVGRLETVYMKDAVDTENEEFKNVVISISELITQLKAFVDKDKNDKEATDVDNAIINELVQKFQPLIDSLGTLSESIKDMVTAINKTVTESDMAAKEKSQSKDHTDGMLEAAEAEDLKKQTSKELTDQLQSEYEKVDKLNTIFSTDHVNALNAAARAEKEKKKKSLELTAQLHKELMKVQALTKAWQKYNTNKPKNPTPPNGKKSTYDWTTSRINPQDLAGLSFPQIVNGEDGRQILNVYAGLKDDIKKLFNGADSVSITEAVTGPSGELEAIKVTARYVDDLGNSVKQLYTIESGKNGLEASLDSTSVSLKDSKQKIVDFAAAATLAKEKVATLAAQNKGLRGLDLSSLDALTNITDADSLDAFNFALSITRQRIAQLKAEAKTIRGKAITSVGDADVLIGQVEQYVNGKGISTPSDTLFEKSIEDLRNARNELEKALASDYASQNNLTEDEYAILLKNLENGVKSTSKVVKDELKKAFDLDNIVDSPFGNIDLGAQNIGDELWSKIKDYYNQHTDQGVATFKNFNDAQNQLKFTVKDGAGTFTEYTVAANQADGAIKILKTSVQKLDKDLEKSNSSSKEFIKDIASFSRQFVDAAVGGIGIHEFAQQIRQGVVAVKEIDAAMTELRKVTDETEAAYSKFMKTMSSTGSKVGGTVTDLINSAADWSRLGYSMEEAGKLAESTAILMNVSEFDNVDNATKALTSSLQAFKYGASKSIDIVDVFNEIGNKYAVSVDGIATALQNSASALVEGGNTLEEAVALVASAMKYWLNI